MTRTAGRRVSKVAWYNAGGLKNSLCYRRADKRGVWKYYILEA